MIWNVKSRFSHYWRSITLFFRRNPRIPPLLAFIPVATLVIFTIQSIRKPLSPADRLSSDNPRKVQYNRILLRAIERYGRSIEEEDAAAAAEIMATNQEAPFDPLSRDRLLLSRLHRQSDWHYLKGSGLDTATIQGIALHQPRFSAVSNKSQLTPTDVKTGKDRKSKS